jgi:hypothetical protein
MNNFDYTTLEKLSLGGNVLRIENALIEEVVTSSRKSGFLLISYRINDENNLSGSGQIRLNISRNTIIIKENGDSLNLSDLKVGMRIDAEFSSAMTRSIPPQSNAYRIIVLSEEKNINVTTDRIVNVDSINGLLTTGNPYDIYDQMRFSVSDNTLIIDQYDNPIPLAELQPGQLIRVEHAIFQTMSIPPQSPAYRIQVI